MRRRMLFSTVALLGVLLVGCESAGEEPTGTAPDETTIGGVQELAEGGDDSPFVLADYVVDSDGSDSGGVGDAVDAVAGDELHLFTDQCAYPLGVIDNDKSGDWSLGDDLITDARWMPGGTPTYLGKDDIVLDLDDSLAKESPQVDFWEAPDLARLQLAYIATNDDGCWEPGEDIVLDTNGNGLLDSYQSWGG